MMSFEWIIGKGPSEEALVRLQINFPRPLHPMGEAWFNSDSRKYFDELIEKELDDISASDINHYLFEIASGTSSFGHSNEWTHWFLYLLPRLIRRCMNSIKNAEVFQNLVTTFVCLNPDEIEAQYESFRDDVIATLPHCLMANDRWSDWVDRSSGKSDKRPSFLETSLGVHWSPGNAHEDLSAAMFFCLKYLFPDEIKTWVTSLLTIRDPYWRAAIIVWLSGVFDLLKSEEVTWKMIEESSPKIVWSNSYLIKSRWTAAKEKQLRKLGYYSEENLLPLENRSTFLTELKKILTAEAYLEWVESLASEPKIEQLVKYYWESFFDKLVSD